MAQMTYATAINCMDGRTQLPVIEFIMQKYHVDFVDMITEPGPNKILADSIMNHLTVESIKKRVDISVKIHGSKLIAVVGHHGCAGNPAGKGLQMNHTRSAISTVKSWNFDVEIIGLWVEEDFKVSMLDL